MTVCPAADPQPTMVSPAPPPPRVGPRRPGRDLRGRLLRLAGAPRAETPLSDIVGTVAYLPIGLLVAWVSWHTGDSPGLDRPPAASVAASPSFLALWATGSLWTLIVVFDPPSAFREWTDWITTLHALLLVGAYLSLPPPAES